MKVLKGQKLTDADFANVESQLKYLMYLLIYKPLVDLLAPHNAQVKQARTDLKKEVRNAKYDPIVSGINSGKIQYVADTFSGEFNATISKALRSYGAKWNKKAGTFTILEAQLPPEVKEAAKGYAQKAKDYHEELEKKLKEIEMTLTYQILQNPIDASIVIGKMDKKFMELYGDALGTEDLSENAKERLKKGYSEALRPYIKKFGDEQILDLREMVTENARTGYRFDALIDKIQNRFDVSQTKAAFLARQETSMFVSQVRQVRFREVGITKYIWRTSGDSEVRPDHRKLNGREFEYAKPPVVDEATGRRGNPGIDFNCRCIAEPVMPEVFA